MFKLVPVLILSIFFYSVDAQYKYDNVLYKTVYAQDLHTQLKLNPGYLFLDVRSKGEFSDTSNMTGMNLGRLKNAKNINVNELGTKINQLNEYKNKPVFVYCSHSQRSRRACKMLADSGFTNLFNINGGMTTFLQTPGSIHDLYKTTNKYLILSPAEFCNEVNNNNPFILDLRSDSSFKNNSTSITLNALGNIRNAHNIPYEKLKYSLDVLPRDKSIILIDEFGDQSADAAMFLITKGFTKISILFDGLLNFVNTNSADLNCKNLVWIHDTKFQLISVEELDELRNHDPGLTILDVRNKDEFENRSKTRWRNIGHVKNAINIPADQIPSNIHQILSSKDAPFVIYSFSSDSPGYNAASALANKGFTKVYLLSGGLFNIRWRANNIKGKSSLKDLVTDVPEENL